MQITKLFSLAPLACMLLACNDSTPPTASTQPDGRVPSAINALTKRAADQAGYAVAAPGAQTDFTFTPDMITALRNAGLCENFVELVQELASNPQSQESVFAGPRFQQVVMCLDEKSQAWANTSVDPTDTEIRGVIEDCFCNGSGSLFLNFTGLTRYSAPVAPGGGYRSPSTGTPYSAPQPAGGYSAPASAGGHGYSAPSL